jgi:galactoside O-acetyltransferase
VVVGTGATVLPGASIGDGIAVGAMALVRVPLLRPGVYVGVPARWLRERSAGSA